MKIIKNLIGLFILALLVFLGIQNRPEKNPPLQPQIIAEMPINSISNPGTVVFVPLQNPMELDYKSKDEILAMRTDLINQIKELKIENYIPNKDIFDGIVDNKPWWGLEGLYGLAASPRSIDGPSEESRFIMNPYLLIGLCENHGWKNNSAPDGNANYYPFPMDLVFDSGKQARVRYNVSDHFSYLRQNNFVDAEKNELTMMAYNARDFGFNYLWVDPVDSSNVTSLNKSAGPAAIRQMIHLGSSCGHPDGCNNASPYQEDLMLSIQSEPARAHIKLWKSKPAAVTDEADFVFIIDLI